MKNQTCKKNINRKKCNISSDDRRKGEKGGKQSKRRREGGRGRGGRKRVNEGEILTNPCTLSDVTVPIPAVNDKSSFFPDNIQTTFHNPGKCNIAWQAKTMMAEGDTATNSSQQVSNESI